MKQEKNVAQPGGLPTRELSFFWAAAILFQYISQLSWVVTITQSPLSFESLLQSALVLSAAALLLFPGSSRLLILTAALHLSHVLVVLPDIPNHRLFTGLVNAAILIGACKNRKSPWESAAPDLRILLIVLYFFAALAKTNSAYIDPSVSCATQFLREMPLWSSLPPALGSAVAWGSLCFEWLLPILLLTPAFRSAAILFGLMFHFIISFDSARHFVDFSSVATASLLAFSPVPIISEQLRRPLGIAVVLGFTACVYLGAAALFNWNWYFYFTTARDLLWLLYGGCAIGYYILARPRWKTAPLARPFKLDSALQTAPIVLAIANGFTPYAGLKTKSSWDMYSNMRLEGSAPNHALGTLDLRGEMRSPIRILESTNATLQTQFADAGFDITPFELRRIFTSDPAGKTSFEWNGTVYRDYSHGTGNLPLSKPAAWLDRKLTWFRPIDRNAAARCQR